MNPETREALLYLLAMTAYAAAFFGTMAGTWWLAVVCGAPGAMFGFAAGLVLGMWHPQTWTRWAWLKRWTFHSGGIVGERPKGERPDTPPISPPKKTVTVTIGGRGLDFSDLKKLCDESHPKDARARSAIVNACSAQVEALRPAFPGLPPLIVRDLDDGSASIELRADLWRLLVSIEPNPAESGWSFACRPGAGSPDWGDLSTLAEGIERARTAMESP